MDGFKDGIISYWKLMIFYLIYFNETTEHNEIINCSLFYIVFMI